MPIKLSDMQQQLTELDPATAWGQYIVTIATCLPFWEQAITEMAELTGLESKKALSYRAAARNAFSLMNNWYFEQTPYVKARRNEIDAAISFIRNSALRQNIAAMPGAAAARNLAGVLRITGHMSVHNYPAKQYPRLMVGGLLDIAAAKSLFPVDTGDLISQFALPGQPPSDNIDYLQDALQRGAEHYGLTKALARTYETLNDLWDRLDAPKPWVVTASAWEPQETSLLAEVHYKGVQDFYTKNSSPK